MMKKPAKARLLFCVLQKKGIRCLITMASMAFEVFPVR
jgi:hypothetical protein